jgi:dipeptidase E
MPMPKAESPRLLLLSNSSQHGRGYLDHAEEEIRAFFAGVRRVLFVPYALNDGEGYTARARERLGRLGYEVDGLHAASVRRKAVEQAEAIFVGGGNTFRLLARLDDEGLLEPVRRRVLSEAPYLGASAGTNLACPTIMTTNDMPIVHPPSLAALGLVPFQINCHYIDRDPGSTHMGESREDRLREYHEMNATPVIGLREGTWLRAEAGRIVLGGSAGARLFRRGQEPQDLAPGEQIDPSFVPA